MQRLNRSAHAPVGTAFFLFLGLAILPASLKLAGVEISFNPRLSAAMDAWRQIAEVFGSGSIPEAASELSAVKDLDSNPSNPISSPGDSGFQFACERTSECSAQQQPEELRETSPATVNDLSVRQAIKASSAKRALTRVARCDSLETKQVVAVMAASFEDHARPIGVLGARKLDIVTREELVKDREEFVRSIEREVGTNPEAIAAIRNLPIPFSKSFRFLVRTKRTAVSSSAKAAECKVFSVLDSARRRQSDRAILTSIPSKDPDNSEF